MAADFVSIDFDTSHLDAFIDNVVEKSSEFIRQATQAGAAVIYAEVKYRVPVIEGKGHTFYGTHGKYFFPAGTLRDSTYQVYSKDNSVDGVRATYHIAWNHKKAPYGFMVEFGTSRAPAHPFLRPGYDASKDLALVVARDKYLNLMESAIPELKR